MKKNLNRSQQIENPVFSQLFITKFSVSLETDFTQLSGSSLYVCKYN